MESPTILKVILVGEAACGKTCFLRRATNDTYNEEYWSTIGAEFSLITSENTHFQMWDTAGQHKFKSVLNVCYKGASIVVFMIDVSAQNQLEKLADYLESCNSLVPEAIKLLVATKIDLPGRQISTQKGEAYAGDHDMLYLEFSAKEGDKNVILSKLQEAAEKHQLQSSN